LLSGFVTKLHGLEKPFHKKYNKNIFVDGSQQTSRRPVLLKIIARLFTQHTTPEIGSCVLPTTDFRLVDAGSVGEIPHSS
jgi:hypothetical protein